MISSWRSFIFAGLAAIQLSGAAGAQASSNSGAEANAAATGDLPVGQPENRVGSIYVDEVFGDWEKRCVRSTDGNDRCQLYQLIQDSNGSPVAEFTTSPLEAPEGQAVAGGTIITPLETLLTGQLRLAVDSGETKVYPFRFCQEIGCYVRLGFTEEDISAFKRGNVARITIIPLQAPDQTVTLEASLIGFTAGYDNLMSGD